MALIQTHHIKNLKNLILVISLAGISTISTMPLMAQCGFSGLNTSYCTNSSSTSLIPSIGGGVFSGPGVVGSTFSPSLAGVGTHTIAYTSCNTAYSLTSSAFTPSATAGTSVALADDQMSGAFPIGFSFDFFCNAYSNFYISSNGFITFSANQPNGCCQGGALPNTNAPNNIIAFAWTDLNPAAGGTITYSTVGVMPNRKLLISFTGINQYSGGSNCCAVTSQIQLHETTNIIEIHTTSKPNYTGTSTYSTTMGIENNNGTVAYTVPGRNAAISWTATNECYRWTPHLSCSISQTTTVSAAAVLVSSDTVICVGGSATLSAMGNATYTWNINLNTSSVVVSPSFNTTYAVAATSSLNCVSFAAITVSVETTPTVSATSSGNNGGVCPGNTVSLTGSGASSYTWSGGISDGIPFTINAATAYTLSGSNACGTSSTAISVSVHTTPIVIATASQPSICSGFSSILTASGTAMTYIWQGNQLNPSTVSPQVTTSYTVVGTSAQGCTASAAIVLTVVATPQGSIVVSPSVICAGSSVTLSSSGASIYTWNSSIGLFFTASIVVSPNTTTTFTLTRTNLSCVNVQTVSVLVNSIPAVFAIATPTSVCQNQSAILTSAGASTYTWNAASPSFSVIGNNITVTPVAPTIYTVTGFNGNCQKTATVFLNVKPNPTVSITSSSSALCIGQSATLIANSVNSYTWSGTGMNPTINTASIIVSPTASSVFSLIAENQFNCKVLAIQPIVVNLNPTLKVTSNPQQICVSGSTTLTATGADTYIWDSGTNSAKTATVKVNPVSTTIYSTTGTFSNTGCNSSQTVLVNVFSPTLSVNSPTYSCRGGTINLIAGPAKSYTWSNGTPFYQTQISPIAPTVHFVSATINSLGLNCIVTQSVNVILYNDPTIAIVPLPIVCRLSNINISASGASTYTWGTGQNGSTITTSLFSNTVMVVKGTDLNGCSASDSVKIHVTTCQGFDKINMKNKFGLSVFPNPTSGSVTIKSEVAIDMYLFNSIGQKIKNIALLRENNMEFFLEDLTEGIYFLTGEINGNRFIEKIVVTH